MPTTTNKTTALLASIQQLIAEVEAHKHAQTEAALAEAKAALAMMRTMRANAARRASC